MSEEKDSAMAQNLNQPVTDPHQRDRYTAGRCAATSDGTRGETGDEFHRCPLCDSAIPQPSSCEGAFTAKTR